MQNPFDPTFLLARYLHPSTCDDEHDFDEAECLRVAPAVEDLRRALLEAGLAIVPVETIEHLERAFGELVGGEAEPEAPLEGIDGPPSIVADLYEAQVRIRMRMRDGSVEYSDPVPRWHAEILLGLLGFDHGAELASARIEPEPAWIGRLVEELPGL